MKRLVVCCDGTWNAAGDGKATNVQRLCARIAERGDDGVEQRTRYLAGVGGNAGAVLHRAVPAGPR